MGAGLLRCAVSECNSLYAEATAVIILRALKVRSAEVGALDPALRVQIVLPAPLTVLLPQMYVILS